MKTHLFLIIVAALLLSGCTNTDELVTLTFQPMQCEIAPWQEWYEAGNAQFLTQPNEEEIAVAYFGAQGIDVIDFERIEKHEVICESCYTCPQNHYFTITVAGNDAAKVRGIGFEEEGTLASEE